MQGIRDVITLGDLPDRIRATNATSDGTALPAGHAVSAPPVAVPLPTFPPASPIAAPPGHAIDPNVDYKDRLRLEMPRSPAK